MDREIYGSTKNSYTKDFTNKSHHVSVLQTCPD